MATKEPQMLASLHGKKSNTILEDYLYPIDTRTFNGYNFPRVLILHALFNLFLT